MQRLFVLLALVLSPCAATQAANCESIAKGYPPLTVTSAFYKGQQCGLWAPGFNVATPLHDSAGRALGTQFLPRDSLGNVDSLNGAWVLLSVGMSNCTQEFSVFITTLTGDTSLNPYLRIVDGAQGGQTAARIKYDTASFWNVVNLRLKSKGLSARQVQAIWLKEANSNPTQAFPVHATVLRDDLMGVVRLLPTKFPNIRQVFLSSRTYGGYASSALNPEPYAYESGFSVRWLIDAQMFGNDSVNFDPGQGPVTSPWLGWGPYLWADGVTPRPVDSLQWFCGDFLPSDGTHPSDLGRAKVAALLRQFFRTSPYTIPWFLKSSPPAYLCGDADGSGVIDISDAVFLVAYIFTGGPAPNPLAAGDANCEATIDISDAVYLIAFIFAGGPPPCSGCL